jgi:hypothetical protein
MSSGKLSIPRNSDKIRETGYHMIEEQCTVRADSKEILVPRHDAPPKE